MRRTKFPTAARDSSADAVTSAARTRPAVHVTRYPLRRADEGLADLATDRVTGVAVLLPE
ncbi:hypothetical protein PUR71_30055 [Streptomyces sp. SP17BM10]|uniref:hypothetical protein n=1 Tax=Streptomyces sp. SP17BM10 TaxID=3002530 RepID=UPI002E7A7396|nr:hypothetical protein [Streptomyces sp. SP17BM10]MEE1787119.1 hypothetical protein [Streptomyces sp. SP17BM10]